MVFKRGKNNIQMDRGLDYLYDKYVKETGNPYNISKNKFRKVWQQFSKKAWDIIIFKNYEFVMPYRLGSVRIRTFKKKIKIDENGEVDFSNMPVDYKATLSLWESKPEAREARELIYIFNDHSDGMLAKIYWDKSTCTTKNHRRYAFVPTRTNKRMVSKAIKEHKIIHYS